MMKRRYLATALVFLLVGSAGWAQQIQLEATTLDIKVLASNINLPWDLEWGPEGNIWYSTREGGIFRLNPDDGSAPKQIHFIPDVFTSDDNSGLHALALHPDFPVIPYVYVNYTHSLFRARVERYTYNLVTDGLESPVTIIDDIPANASHNGSRIIFDENQNMYFCLGDAFSPGFSQSVQELNGKILKMKADGAGAADSPYGDMILSIGHRNPQGLTFGRNGLLYSSEHGGATDDELNLIEVGRNYGWPEVEGFCDNPSEAGFCDEQTVKEPLMVWTPTDAPAGLGYFDHPSIPEWQNSLIQCFLKANRISVIRLSEDGREVLEELEFLEGQFGRLRDVLITPNGRVFLSSSNQETNGNGDPFVKPDDDKIIELVNTDYEYPAFVKEFTNLEAEIFPIPLTDERLNLVLRDSETQPIRMRLIGTNGQEMASWDNEVPNLGIITLDLSWLDAGVYVLEIDSPVNGVTVKKIVKQ